MGRPLGSKNKKTSHETVRAKSSEGETPLQYMLKLMRNTRLPRTLRLEVAKAAAPYMHSRLQSSTVAHTGTLTLENLVTESIKPVESVEVETERPATTH